MNSLFGGSGATGRRSSGGMSRGDSVPSGYKVGQLQQFTPEQMELFKNSFQHVGPNSYLSRLASGDQSYFDEMEAPALRQFNALQGNIASRYSAGGGAGSLSGRRSSGFQNEMTSASSDFAQKLQANRQNLQRQALLDLSGMTSELLGQRPYERDLFKKQEKQPSGWGSIAGGLLGGVGGAFFGAPVQGAMIGSQIGSMF